MTKKDLSEHLYERLGLSKAECDHIIEVFLGTVKKALADGEDVKLSGFGKFSVKEKKARPGRNPQTGEKMEISPRKVVKFKLSEIVKGDMNAD